MNLVRAAKSKLLIWRVLLPALVMGLPACRERSAEGKKNQPPPAQVANAVPESKLATLTLTPEACARLGLETQPAARKNVARTRTLGGEVRVPPGHSISVTAPMAGTLLPAESGVLPAPGTRVEKGQTILRLLPLLSTERLNVARAQADISDAEGQVRQAQVRVDAARVRVERADELEKEKVGSARAADEAHAELALAEADLSAAQARLDILQKILLSPEPAALTTIPLQSPQAGLLQSMAVSPGQTVAAGARLFDVISMNPLWIRVPVYVGSVQMLDLEHEVSVIRLGDPPGAAAAKARAVPAPPSADLDAATVDVFFEISGPDENLRPGQRVGVVLRLRGEEQELVVPWSAVLFDIHGSAWVYENHTPGVYERRRVEVRCVVDDLAVLARGPAPGTPVVTVGAAELFGTEFGIGK